MARAEWNSEGYTIRYLCPQCGCSHVINVGVIDKGLPIWKFNGDFERPTLDPSVHIVGKCHHWIKDGFIEFCNDDCNLLKNQKLPLDQVS